MGTNSGGTVSLSLSSTNLTTAVWSGTVSKFNAAINQFVTGTGTFTATITAGDASWVTPASASVGVGSGIPLELVKINSGTSFAMNVLFAVNGTPFDTWYNS